jgi:hypothetical protein
MDLKKLCCQMSKAYSEKYDCYYCDTCNIWLEDICTDRDCEFCKDRPLTPKEGKENGNPET